MDIQLTREYILSLSPSQLNDRIDDLINYKHIAGDYPNWSGDIRASWELVEKMGDKGWMLYKLSHTLKEGKINGYECIFLNIETGASREVKTYSAPPAIARCALLTTIQT